MMRKRYASLIGALGALFILSSSAEAGWWDKLNDWLEDFNRRNDPREFTRQLNYNSTANCKKYFEKGDIERAKLFCVVAVKNNREVAYHAAIAEYKYGVKDLARGYFKEAEKDLLERLEIEKGNAQKEIEIKKKLANVYLYLGEIYKEIYEKLSENYSSSLDKEAREIAEGYYKKAMTLTDELGDNGESYVIARAASMLGSLYLDKARYSYNWIKETETLLNKALNAIEKAQPSVLFSKAEIQWTKIDIYNLMGIVQIDKHRFKKAEEQDYKKGEEYFLKAIDIAKRVNPNVLPSLKHNLAVLHLTVQDYDKYAKYTEEAIELEKKKGPKSDKKKLAEWYEELADIYAKQIKNKKRAIECFDSAIQLYYDLAKLMERKGKEIERLEYERKQRVLRGEIKKLYEETN